MDNIIFELGALRSELAHCRGLQLKQIQAFADLVVTAETSKLRSDVYKAWAFISDSEEAKIAFEQLAQAAIKTETALSTRADTGAR